MGKLNSFYHDMPKVWGENWSVTSEIGKLRAVMVHRRAKRSKISKIRRRFILEILSTQKKPDGSMTNW